jgi:hypothetical protein
MSDAAVMSGAAAAAAVMSDAAAPPDLLKLRHALVFQVSKAP